MIEFAICFATGVCFGYLLVKIIEWVIDNFCGGGGMRGGIA